MKRFIASIFVTLLFFVFTISPVLAALQPLPASSSPFNLRDRYQTDLFTGSASYSYPIKVPKGTNDLTPDVSLSYNSAGARDLMQRTGIGWQLSQDYVERDVNFTPTNTGDDKFKLHFKGGVYDLVYVAADNRYHTKIESNLNIQKLTGDQNSYSEYWQVITQDGTKYRFGYGGNAEFVANARPYVTYWSLDLVTDTHSNTITYTYIEGNGTAYLSQIAYNNDGQRIIAFTYTTAPYQRELYIQGASTLEYSRLSTIQVKIGTSLIHQYDLNYATAANNQSLLQSITEKGSDGTALPATTFEYKSEVKSLSTTPDTWVNNAPMDVHLEKTDVVMADANGDGLLDIVKSEGNGTNTWKVWKNTGTGWNTTYETWVNNAPMDAKLDRADTRFLDVTGDGLPDIVKTDGINGNQSTWKVWRNTGSSWNTTAEIWINNAPIDAYLGKDGTGLVDVNGDGLADIVKSYNHDLWKVNLNTGSSWATQDQTWASALDANLTDTDTRLLDVNGDGLVDIVRTTYSGTNDTWKVWKNTGSGWITTPELWINNAGVDAHLAMTNVTIADINGDGLPDIVKSIDGGSADTWKALVNRGASWSTTWEDWIPASANVDLSLQANTQMADVNGDGLADVVRTGYSGSNDTWQVWKNNGNAPDLLSTVHTAQGGTISFDYTKSTQYTNTGSDSIPDLPFSLWLVTKMTVNNGLTNTQGTNDVTTYSYKNGLYSWQNREFRGFGQVDETDPDTSKKQYLFNQDDARRGTLASVTTTDASNNLYAKTENTWSNAQANGIFTVNLTQEKQSLYDGNAASPKVTQIDYQYDTYGNVTKKSEQGDTSVTGDERFTYFEYVVNTTAWIVNTLKHTYQNSSDDFTKISESWLYYDAHPGLDDQPTKGDVTKEVKWLSGGTNPVTQYTYNNFGNQTSMIDANNHTTQVAYDTTGTYPVNQTNAKNQITTTSYDLGTGNLLSKTDPNGFQTLYSYDVFGRITKEVKPYDTVILPTTSYQYFDNVAAPQGVLVSKREVSGSALTLDAYTFVDGLGRKIQTRAEAEDTTKQIVTDTFYDPNGQIAKQTVAHLDALTTAYVAPIAGLKNTTMSYDPLARVTILTNPKGDAKTTAYDHWKETSIDENGHIKRQYFTADGKINKVEEVNGVSTYTTTYTYDTRDLLTKITDNAGNNTMFTYDSLGQKKSQTDPDMGTWNYTYDAVGNVATQKDNRNITITKTYDELNRITKTDYPTDTDTLYTYDGNSKIGTLTSVTDATGITNYSYDNRLRKTQEQHVMDGTTWTTQFAYDALDRMSSQTNPDGEVVTYAFNPQGEVNSVNGIVNNIDYNALGKITKKDFANGLTTNYTYNTNDFRLNRIQTGTVQDMNYTYDNVGNVATRTNNLTTKTETFGYDDLDRLKTATENSGYNYAYEYSPIGNLTKFTDSGVDTNYTYGQSAGAHAMTSAGNGQQAPSSYTAQYFNNQTLTGTPTLTRTDATINFDWGQGSPDVSIPVDHFSARWTKTENFSAGTYQFSMTGDDGIRLYIDNVLVIDKWTDQGPTTYTTTQSLAAGSHTIKMEYYENTGGAVAKLSYQQVVGTNVAFQKPVTVDSTYSNYFGSNAVDGVISDTSRWINNDTTNPPHWLEIDFGGTYTIARWELYNGLGNSNAISNFVLQSWNGSSWIDIPGTSTTGNTNIAVSQVFTTPVTTTKVRFYSTDSPVVRVKEINVYTGSTNQTPNTTYTYDANGSMLSDGTKCYTYNEANQLKSVKQCSNNQLMGEYWYDYTGERIKQNEYTNGILDQTVYAPTKEFEAKRYPSGTVDNTTYYKVNDEIVARKNPDGSKRYYHNDHLGSTSVLTRQDQSILEQTTYYPFGEVRTGGTGLSRYQYTGKEKDQETGLNYYGARYYDSHIRRFTQADDIMQNPYNPQDLNRYSYVRNNPLRYTDPTGHAVVFQNGRIVSTLLSPAPQQKKSSPIASYIPSYSAAQNTPARSSGSNNSGGSTVAAAGAAAGSIGRNRALGNAYEIRALNANGYTKNTSLIGDFGNIIPDIDAKDVGDVKRVKYLSNTKQMRNIIDYARDTGRDCVVICPIETDLSKPIQANLESLGGGKSKIIRWGSMAAEDLTLPVEASLYFIHRSIIDPSYINTSESTRM